MQPEAQLHVVGRQWREGCWNTGSLDEIPPLVMQLEAQLRVVRWEWDGREMKCWEFEGNQPLVIQPGVKVRRWLYNCMTWGGSGGGGSWNAGSFIKPVMLPPV